MKQGTTTSHWAMLLHSTESSLPESCSEPIYEIQNTSHTGVPATPQMPFELNCNSSHCHPRARNPHPSCSCSSKSYQQEPMHLQVNSPFRETQAPFSPSADIPAIPYPSPPFLLYLLSYPLAPAISISLFIHNSGFISASATQNPC